MIRVVPMVVPDKAEFTVEEVADVLNVTMATAYRWVRQGRIRSRDLRPERGRRPTYRVPKKSLETAVKQLQGGLRMPVAS